MIILRLLFNFIWWGLLGVAIIVFFVGLGVAISGNIVGGIIILAIDWVYMELIKPGRFI